MGRIPDGRFPKEKTSISIDGEILLRFNELTRVSNLSSWVEERMRQEILNLTLMYQCKCGVVASVQVWQLWRKKCRECGQDHNLIDSRKTIKPVME